MESPSGMVWPSHDALENPMKTRLLAVLLLLPALAAAQSGKQLQGDCSAALQLLNHENVSGEPQDFIKIGNCLGFVNGVMQTATLGKAGPFKNFCAPADVSVEQVGGTGS
jgi:hypothetical protein